MSVEKFVVGLVKEQIRALIKKQVEALEARVTELRRGAISSSSLHYLDGGIQELENLVLELNTLVEFPLVPEGGMVLSPREVEVVQCFAGGWDDGDDRSLYGHLCYQDAFDLMKRLDVSCSGVRDLVDRFGGSDDNSVD